MVTNMKNNNRTMEKVKKLRTELSKIVSEIKALQKLRKRKANHIYQIEWQAKKKASLNLKHDTVND